MIRAYFKIRSLDAQTKEKHNIKSKDRLDCVSCAGEYKGLTNFVNKKGQLYFYKTPCRGFVNTDSKRLAEWSLTGNGLNLSSIYIDDVDYPEIGYGYPNSNRLLSNGRPNPQFHFRNDAYLFHVNKDYSEIEIFIISDGRNLISSYYQMMIEGDFDREIKELKQSTFRFFNY